MSDPKRPLGPNFKKFVFLKMAKDAVPDGEGLSAALTFLSKGENISVGFRSAVDWCDAAVQIVRSAGEPNPWKHSNEEEIAGELVRRIEERKQR